MNEIRGFQPLQLSCSLFWGERRKIRENVQATLYWQPLRETNSSFWLDPEVFNLSFWKNYRPDNEQKLIFTSTRDNLSIQIWINEYDVRDYLRGWKNTPSFRVLSIDFINNKPEKPVKLPYQEYESWFMVPGKLPISGQSELKTPIHIQPAPFATRCIISSKLFAVALDHLELELHSGTIDSVPVLMARIFNCESLQAETTHTCSQGAKSEYDIVCSLLTMLLTHNLSPVWQIIRAPKSGITDWQHFVFYERDESARNLIPQHSSLEIDPSLLSLLHTKLTQKNLWAFTACFNELDAFQNLLAIHNLPKRLKESVNLLSKIIGWEGHNPDKWAGLLQQEILNTNVQQPGRFLNEVPKEMEDYTDAWDQLDDTLQSLYPLVAGDSPSGTWHYGKNLIERNKLVLELLRELILKRHFKSL